MSLDVDPELGKRLDAVRAEENRRQKMKERIWQERRILIPLLLVALIGFYFLRTGEVVGRSMQPIFQDGNRLLILRHYEWISPLHIGDIVVANPRDAAIHGEIVKRVVFVQNAAGDAPFPDLIENSRGKYPFREMFPRYVDKLAIVPPHYMLLMGDNVDNSTDSRDFGPVSPHDVVGKIVHF